MNILRRNRGGPRVELLCVGTELLTGKLNTHGAYFSAWLEDMGLPLVRETTVSDDPEEMEAAFRDAWRRAGIVIVTGGLGPTFDDVTRDVWARVTGRPLVFRRELLDGIAARFKRRGLRMPRANRRQAYVLRGARAIQNENGTAPGQILTGRKTLILLPGPGRELKPMIERDVRPFLLEKFSPGHRVTRVWRFFGLGESKVDEGLRALFRSSPNEGLLWGILAQGGVVDVKATAACGPERARKILARLDRALRRRFGPAVFGEGTETLEGVVGAALRRAGKTLAVAESCTGGLLAKKITDVPGSSGYFWGGVVSYDNDGKRRLLGVPERTLGRHGAVSRETALSMARGLKKLSRADYVLAVTGIAGPGGGTETKPVGLVHIALAGPRALTACEKRLAGDRPSVREQAALWSLDLLRRHLP